MLRVFIDLSDNVALMLAKDRYIVFYEEFEYSLTLIDLIYSKLANLQIEEAVVVLHGSISEKLSSGDLAVQNAYAMESFEDYSKMEHLFKVLGVPKLFFYEYAGYYLLGLSNEPCLLINQENSKFNLAVYRDGFVHTSICTKDNLQQETSVLCNKYELTQVIDVKNVCLKPLLDYYANLDTIKDSRLHNRLALFSYTMTKNSSEFRITKKNFSSVRTHLIENPEQVDVADEPADFMDSLDESAPAKSVKKEKNTKVGIKQEKKPKIEKKSRGKKKSKGVFGIIFALLLVIVTLAIVVLSNVLSAKAASSRKLRDSVNNQYLTQSAQLNAYKRAEKHQTAAKSTQAGPSIISQLNFSKCSELKLVIENTTISITCSFPTEKEATKFTKDATNRFKVLKNDVSTTGKKSVCSLAIAIA